MKVRLISGLLLSWCVFSCVASASNNSPRDFEKRYSIKPYTLRTDSGDILLKFKLKEKSNLLIKLLDFFEVENEALYSDNQYKEYNPEIVHSINLGKQNCGTKLNLSISGKNESVKIQREVASYPCPDSLVDEEVIFGFITDTQSNMRRYKTMANFITKRKDFGKYSFVLNAGDIVNTGGRQGQWDDFFKIGYPYISKVPLVSAIGNHSYFGYKKNKDPITANFKKYMRWEGAEEFGGVFIKYPQFSLIVFNSIMEKLSKDLIEKQWVWVEEKLSEAQKRGKPILFTMHYPPYSSWFFQKSDRAQLLRTKLVPLLEKYRVKIVFTGHVHFYERSQKNGVTYLTGGPAGGSLAINVMGKKNKYSKFKKFLVSTLSEVRINSQQIKVESYDARKERLIDSFTIDL